MGRQWGFGPSSSVAFLSIKITKETKATETGRRKQSTSTPSASGNQQEQTHPGVYLVNDEYLTKTPFYSIFKKNLVNH